MDNKTENGKGNRIAVFMLIAAGALIILLLSALSLGWFTNNNTVEGNSMGMTATKNPFELGTENKAGYFDSYLWANDGAKTDNVFLNDGSKIELTATGEGNPEVKWLINSESDFGNSTSEGIQPGSCGKLTFYVIAKENTDLYLNFSLDMILYDSGAEENKDNTEHIIPETEAVTELVKGHILFFGSYDEQSGIYSGPITENGFTFTQKGAKENTAYKVDFYWVWPLLADQIILPTDDSILRAKGYKRIIPDSLSLFSDNNLSCFFADSEQINSAMISNVSGGSDSAAFSSDYYHLISGKWNEADQIIGTNAAYIELQLTADTAAADNP